MCTSLRSPTRPAHSRCRACLNPDPTTYRFFNRVQDYRIEEELYGDAAAKAVLPQLFASSANEDGAACSRGGYRFPPFLVMERGMTLTEWLSQGASRTPLAVLSMFADCATLLTTLHAHGHVHRDLKPDNVLLMLQSQAWCFIDFGIAAPAGAHAPRLLQSART